jgi:tRNA pseudouridine55 synthase
VSFFDPENPVKVSGMLLVDKPAGPTSHDIVHRVRKLTGIDKVGHGGTLDPMASGLLPLLVGEATKMSSFILADDKSYEFDLTLGATTDTDDSTGVVVSTHSVPEDLSSVRLRTVARDFEGERFQQPPMYSAVKQQGVPLYKLARKGVTVPREPRRIEIYSLELIAVEPPVLTFRVHCSKGTYIRVLAREIGEALSTGAHLSRLRRLSVGTFSLAEATTLAVMEKEWAAPDFIRNLLGPDRVFDTLPGVRLLGEASTRLLKGALLPATAIFRREGLFHMKDMIRILGQDGKIRAIAEALREGENLGDFPLGIPFAKVSLVF